jgi:phage terminase small subunit
MSNLTEKQKRFCEEYLIDLNATQSAIRSGYSVKTARQLAQRMLTNVDIQSYIQELREKQSKRTEITADKVLEELGAVAFNREIECIGRDKVRALELIGQHLGMFAEKVSITKEEEIPKLLDALKDK